MTTYPPQDFVGQILRTVVTSARKFDDGHPERHRAETRPTATVPNRLFHPSPIYRHGKRRVSTTDVGQVKDYI